LIYKARLKKIGDNPFILIEDDLAEIFEAYARLILGRYKENVRLNFSRDRR